MKIKLQNGHKNGKIVSGMVERLVVGNKNAYFVSGN